MTEIRAARFPEEREALVALLMEYEEWLGVDLCFQSFREEVAKLPGKYAAPEGNILLAWEDAALAGCIGWYPLKPGICEIKRLFVRPGFHRRGIGTALLERAIEGAKRFGYTSIYLDSMERLKEATQLYEAFGFRRIAPYNDNPERDVYYMALDLQPQTRGGLTGGDAHIKKESV